MTLLIFFLLLALSISFLCSVLEAVILTATIPYIEQLKQQGKNIKNVERLKQYKENIDRPLASILSLNTIAHTIGASGVGAQATQVFGEVYFGIVSIILTLLILICSEIIPKSIGAKYWRSLVIPTAKVLPFFIFSMYPFVIISESITKMFSKNKKQNFSREEISAIANMGTREGIFAEIENKILQNILRLNNIKVNDVMTPRTVIVAAQQNKSLAEFLSNKDFLHYSRIPIYENSPDDIDGYVLRYDLIENGTKNANRKLIKDFKRKIVYTYQYSNLLKTWDLLLKNKEQLALVISEYGGVEGIITMEDIVETILGLEITDERDANADMQKIARERWKQRQAKYKLHVSEDTLHEESKNSE